MKRDSGALTSEAETEGRGVKRQSQRRFDVSLEKRFPFVDVVVAEKVKRFWKLQQKQNFCKFLKSAFHFWQFLFVSLAIDFEYFFFNIWWKKCNLISKFVNEMSLT